mgnify:CR=1 FL=1
MMKSLNRDGGRRTLGVRAGVGEVSVEASVLGKQAAVASESVSGVCDTGGFEVGKRGVLVVVVVTGIHVGSALGSATGRICRLLSLYKYSLPSFFTKYDLGSFAVLTTTPFSLWPLSDMRRTTWLGLRFFNCFAFLSNAFLF